MPPSWLAYGCDAAQEVEVLRLALAILLSVAGFEEKTRPGAQGMTRGEMYGPLERGDPGEANPKTVRAVQLGRLAAVYERRGRARSLGQVKDRYFVGLRICSGSSDTALPLLLGGSPAHSVSLSTSKNSSLVRIGLET